VKAEKQEKMKEKEEAKQDKKLGNIFLFGREKEKKIV
jgi:hypothetical protein